MELNGETIQALFGDSLSSEFYRILFLFTAAAFIHGRQVRNEIRKQMTTLITVLREDLDAQKEVLEALTGRVTKIESHLNIKESSDGPDFATTRPGSKSQSRH